MFTSTTRRSNVPMNSTQRQCRIFFLTVVVLGVLPFVICLGTAANARPSGGSAEWVRYTDTAEGAFSMDIPAGYQVEGGLYRFGYLDVRWMVELRSPDGKVTIRIGDPNVPPYASPSPQRGSSGRMYARPGIFQMAVYKYQTAQPYAETYAKRRFASVCTSLTKVHSDWTPSMPRDWQYVSEVRPSLASVEFKCTASDGPRIASVFVRTSIQGKQRLWIVDPIISILATPDRVGQAREMTQKMIDSWQETPKWKDYQKSMEQIGLNEMRTSATSSTNRTHCWPELEGLNILHQPPTGDTFHDPLTGNTFRDFRVPKANDHANDLGEKINSDAGAEPGFHPIRNTEPSPQ